MKKLITLLFSLTLIFSLVACGDKNESKDETKTETNVETKTESVEESKDESTTESSKENEIKKEGDNKVLNQINGYQEGNIKATMKTNMGEIKLILFPEAAPKAVENFVKLAEEGYYNGVTFHRVIEGFMIQGGDPTGTGMGGESVWGKPFEDEFDVSYRNFYGALSMANAGPGTNGSQFFIVTGKDNVPANIINQMKEAGEEKGYPESVIKAYEDLGGAFHLDGKHTVFGHVVEGMDIAEKISKVKTDGSDKPLEEVKIESIVIEK